MDFQEVLIWLSGVGAVLATSWVFEFFQFAWFEQLEAKKKQLVFLGISTVVGVGCKVFLNFAPAHLIATISEYFPILFAIFSYLFLGDQFHTKTKVN